MLPIDLSKTIFYCIEKLVAKTYKYAPCEPLFEGKDDCKTHVLNVLWFEVVVFLSHFLRWFYIASLRFGCSHFL